MKEQAVYVLLLFGLNLITTYGYIECSSPYQAIDKTTASKNNASQKLNMSDNTQFANNCKSKTCISKCCSEDTYVRLKKKLWYCEPYKSKFKFDFSSLNLTSHKDKSKVLSTAGDTKYIHLVPSKFNNETFKNLSVNGAGFPGMKTILTDDGMFHLESHNTYDRYVSFKNEKFCIDYLLKEGNPPVVRVWVQSNDRKSSQHLFKPIALTVSNFFLLIVLVVYSLLPELRNLCGKILVAYISSLFGAFLILAIIMFRTFTTAMCVVLSHMANFFFMSFFCWMNVMSFDIWLAFRGYANAPTIHSRGEHCKFLMYGLYAYGLPMGMTIFIGVMNKLDLKHKPWIIQPNIGSKECFLGGGEKLLYFYIPMFVLIIFNWIFFVMTAYNVWRLSQGTGILNSTAAGNSSTLQANKHRFMIYIKLSVVMGLSWLLEIVSFLFQPNLDIWKFTDAYNMFMGVFIFLIFVCKIEIFKKLKKRFQGSQTQGAPSTERSMSSTKGSVSTQDTSLSVICINPKGSAY